MFADHTDNILDQLQDVGRRYRQMNEDVIKSSKDLRMHLNIAFKSVAFIQECTNRTDAIAHFTVRQLLGRLIGSGGASLDFALNGFYQASLMLARDMLETSYLLADFALNPGHVRQWETAKSSKDKEPFKPVKLRERLDAHYGSHNKQRDNQYRFLSSVAGHPSLEGVAFTMFHETADGVRPLFDVLKRRIRKPEGPGVLKIPPFCEPAFLSICLEEIANIAMSIAAMSGKWSIMPLDDPMRIDFLEQQSIWFAHFYPSK